MKYFFLITILALLVSCKSVNKQVGEDVAGADSVAVNYYKGDGTIDTVIAVKILKDKGSIEKLTQFIASPSAELNVLCGYDGSVYFFRNNQVIRDIDFRMNDVNCMIFTFKQDGKYTATVLSPEAKQFLESVRGK